MEERISVCGFQSFNNAVVETNIRFYASTLSTEFEENLLLRSTELPSMLDIKFEGRICQPPFLCAFVLSSVNGFTK